MARRQSWIESANRPDTHFPLENLPYGAFATIGSDTSAKCCVAIGDYLLDLDRLERDGLVDTKQTARVFSESTINRFMDSGADVWQRVRMQLIDLLAAEGEHRSTVESALVDQNTARMSLPIDVAEYTDFYSGRHHAENVGTMLRGNDNALPPNWLHMPIGYNGRASTVVVSGTDICRPRGQIKPAGQDQPVFAPSRRLDIELEMGTVVGSASRMGETLTVAEADEKIFGYVLLNDWSARDIQAWEYQPLGPFQAKAFATSISPWVVSKAALEPFRCATPEREYELLEYLREPGPMHYDVSLSIAMQTDSAQSMQTLSQTNFREMYYSPAQQLAHHTSGGCAMRVGDLLGSGTISGPTPDSRGSLLELSWGGKEPLTLVGGEQRSFLEDGDSISLSGYADGGDYRIGFGECRGKILPARVGA